MLGVEEGEVVRRDAVFRVPGQHVLVKFPGLVEVPHFLVQGGQGHGNRLVAGVSLQNRRVGLDGLVAFSLHPVQVGEADPVCQDGGTFLRRPGKHLPGFSAFPVPDEQFRQQEGIVGVFRGFLDLFLYPADRAFDVFLLPDEEPRELDHGRRETGVHGERLLEERQGLVILFLEGQNDALSI